MRLSRLLRLTTRAFSQNDKLPHNQLVPMQNKRKEEKDPEVALLIKSYLSTYQGKQKIVDYIDLVEYYDKNPDVQQSENLVLELKNEEVTNLFSFVFNNLNRNLCDIIFYSCKAIYNESKANNNEIKN
jgi:hypothetical protein